MKNAMMATVCRIATGFRSWALKPLSAITLAAAFAVAPALAQNTELSALADRLATLERDLRDLQGHVYDGRATPSSGPIQQEFTEQDLFAEEAAGGSAARLSVRMDQLQTQIRTLTGQIEQLMFQQREANRQMEDITYRLQALELGQGVTPGGSGAVPPSSGPLDLSTPGPEQNDDGAAFQLDPNGALTGPVAQANQEPLQMPADPNESFDYARGLLLRGEFVQASNAFQAFLEAHPNNSNAPEARYWLGDTYFALGKCDSENPGASYCARAAQTFLESVEKDPQAPRAAESLMKLGMSLSAIGEQDEACNTFDAIGSSYPNAPESVRQRVRVEQDRAGCA